jgi:AraC family transcriptional regulator
VTALPDPAHFDYVARVNRGVDYIMANLDQPLRLEDVARAACFSPYHFHRIFGGLMGETLASFVKRVRLERAVYLLSHREEPRLTDVALACGFSSSSDFSRSFRGHYGVAPSEFDVEGFRNSRREEMQASLTAPEERHRLQRLPVGENPDGFAVTLRKLPARRVAYIRVQRPYEGDHVAQAASRLLAWAEPRGLADGQWLGYQWDDPEIVALDQCRYDIGVEVPADAGATGEVRHHHVRAHPRRRDRHRGLRRARAARARLALSHLASGQRLRARASAELRGFQRPPVRTWHGAFRAAHPTADRRCAGAPLNPARTPRPFRLRTLTCGFVCIRRLRCVTDGRRIAIRWRGTSQRRRCMAANLSSSAHFLFSAAAATVSANSTPGATASPGR